MARNVLPVLLAASLLGCDGAGPDEELPTPFEDVRAPCADVDEDRRLLWGDTHVHTRLSFDAWVFDVRTTPEEAYRFAQGESVGLSPLDADGAGTQVVRLDRPLDFAAVTDHAEYLGEVDACLDPDSYAYETPTCSDYRTSGNQSVGRWGFRLTAANPTRWDDVCGSIDCLERADSVWDRIQQAAEAAYDRTDACRFTSFVAYEYSGATGASNLHRNVIFRSATVPSRPASFFEFPTARQLWDRLEQECSAADPACDVLAIPHNSNWSNGKLFNLEYPPGATEDEQRAEAERRAAMEPLVEIFQHKGGSECSPGLSGILGVPDEQCDWEKLRLDFDDCGDGTGAGAMGGLGCVSRRDFVRGALLAGLEEQQRLGVNPLPLGIIASTDTHNGTPGLTEEDAWPGHWGNNEDLPERRLGHGSLTPGGVLFSPGGLAAVWAEENSREAIFDAMRRREVYGTSGTRPAVRFFGGWEGLDASLCDAPDLVARADAAGVPMGGELPARPPDVEAPTLLAWAAMDPGTDARAGVPLQRLQVVKLWVDESGASHESVVDIAGDEGGAVDPDTCQRTGAGAAELCAAWTDPDFDPSEHAAYYLRVLENPSCRWTAWACNGLPAADRPETCFDPEVPRTQQERAWTSPIWTLPEGA